MFKFGCSVANEKMTLHSIGSFRKHWHTWSKDLHKKYPKINSRSFVFFLVGPRCRISPASFQELVCWMCLNFGGRKHSKSHPSPQQKPQPEPEPEPQQHFNGRVSLMLRPASVHCLFAATPLWQRPSIVLHHDLPSQQLWLCHLRPMLWNLTGKMS